MVTVLVTSPETRERPEKVVSEVRQWLRGVALTDKRQKGAEIHSVDVGTV